MKLEKLNLANTHLVSILFSLVFIIFFFKAIFLKFLLTALVFQIYLRVLNFSFAYIQAFSSNATLKTIGSLSRAIFSAFLLFLLVKYFSIGADVILLAVSGLIISFIAYGYISSRK